MEAERLWIGNLHQDNTAALLEYFAGALRVLKPSLNLRAAPNVNAQCTVSLSLQCAASVAGCIE